MDFLVLMVTLALLVLLAPLVKMDQRVFVVMPALQEDQEMLGFADHQAYRERKESLERKGSLVLKGPRVPRVWLAPVVLLVCLGSVEREASLVFLDLLESLVNRVLLVLLVTVDLLDQLGLRDLVDLLGSLVERVPLDQMDPLVGMDLLDSRESEVTPVLLALPELLAALVPLAL